MQKLVCRLNYRHSKAVAEMAFRRVKSIRGINVSYSFTNAQGDDANPTTHMKVAVLAQKERFTQRRKIITALI